MLMSGMASRVSIGDSQVSGSYPSRLRSASSGTMAGSSNTISKKPVTSRTTTTTRPKTSRPRTGISMLTGIANQRVVCAVSESRGVSPTVGICFVNLDSSEAVLCQICDSQTYVRTMQKLHLFCPSEILIVSTAESYKSKLLSIIEEGADDLDCRIVLLDRRYWAETTGWEYIQQLALPDDIETLRPAVSDKYFAVCCLAAVLKYVEHVDELKLPYHSFRIKYEPSEGSMMIDVSTIYSLELIQNLRDQRSKDCLFGLLNQTQTPMGARMLRSNILQPLTSKETLEHRYDALDELASKEEMFFSVRQALQHYIDADRLLTSLVIVPNLRKAEVLEQSINNVIMLKHFVGSIRSLHDALTGARSHFLCEIRRLCSPTTTGEVEAMINEVINDDVRYSKSPLDLRHQRAYAVRTGVNGLLDAARKSFKECSEDIVTHVQDLTQRLQIGLELKFEPARQYYLRFPADHLGDRGMNEELVNVVRKKDKVECSTMYLMKKNQKIAEWNQECLLMSDGAVQTLLDRVRMHISGLFKMCESVAMLDMISAFAQLVTSQDYVRPQLESTVLYGATGHTSTLAMQGARHPIKEKIQRDKFVANDVYATPQKRFQIITGCNMSGKSTYIRSVALICVMAQIGSFVPAGYANIPIHHQLFARVNADDSIESNVSTFAAEMQEMAFILRNINRHSIVIVDELGRGTSTRDGLAIAIAISEALIESRAFVWFASHFLDLAHILSERPGVSSLHLAVESPDPSTLCPLYKIASGAALTPHYGLILAKLVPLPQEVFARAEEVAQGLQEQEAGRKRTSEAVLAQRKRRLVLGLKENLEQARNGRMEGEVLRGWVRELQREFVERMDAVGREGGDEGNEGDNDGGDAVALDGSDLNPES